MQNFTQQHVEYFDQPLQPANNLTSFAYTNALLRSSEALPAPCSTSGPLRIRSSLVSRISACPTSLLP